MGGGFTDQLFTGVGPESPTIFYRRYRMNITRPKIFVLTLAFLGVTGCSDSTGPGSVGADDALRSLSLALGSENGGEFLFALPPSSLGSARLLDQIDVVVNGRTERMYALGLRVTYPSGTCLESLVIFPPSQGFPTVCTPPPHGLVLVLWQTTSGSRPPQSLAIISADIGTSDFDFNYEDYSSDGEFVVLAPFGAFAMYINDREEFWTSVGGTLTSQVSATSETCNVPAPPFAKTSTCHVANFAESGQITLERLDLDFFDAGPAAPSVTMNLVIPPQSIRGILQEITQIQPITFPVQ
jgi:hypothetical protein